MAPLVDDLPLVAHNARFDEGCLKAVHRMYRMDYPDYEFHDTLAAYRATEIMISNIAQTFNCRKASKRLCQTVAEGGKSLVYESLLHD